MRLIDADALKADIEQFNRPLCDDYHMKDYVLNQIITDIENQPTVDAMPVKHGKWIHEVRYTIDSLHSYQQYRCSKCGMTYITNTKYCPECGARMDEE